VGAVRGGGQPYQAAQVREGDPRSDLLLKGISPSSGSSPLNTWSSTRKKSEK
jgi:hypothetical protein